ncbi:MAG: polysaccharide biosynthesis C-terminal domain-containing protein [Clostridia bacterium]|nr:polysaccharide biosynthesis C-terminal domain-containing protein [Clostridia bacterium]
MKSCNLGEENLIKVFSVNVIPAIIAMVINGAQPIIDGLFLGKFAGLNAMASVNIVGPFMQIIFAISFIVCTGAISLIGRSLGSGNQDKAQSVFRSSCVFITIVSLLVTIFGGIFSTNIAKLLKATDILVADSAMYIFVISFFAPIICNMYLTGFTTRVIGKPNQYLYGAIVSLCTNVLLDYLFIGLADLGVMGGALATGISYFIALCVCCIPLFKKSSAINFF